MKTHGGDTQITPSHHDRALNHTASTAWPDPPTKYAWQGLGGDLVRAIDPHTEADPIAVLTQLFVAFGNAIGRGAYSVVEADYHYPNLFAVMIGDSSKARKGTSLSRIQKLFEIVDPGWERNCVQSGLVSGEGLIHAVRDPILRPARKRELQKNKLINNDGNFADIGVDDKRLLIVEPEFAQPLKLMAKEGNILSTVIRQAWDKGNLRTLGKNTPEKATGAHVSIIGHATSADLHRYLGATEQANGFGNRFLWACVRRSKCLPEGGGELRDDELLPLMNRLKSALRFAQKAGEIRRSDSASELWRAEYPTLSEGKPGLFGSLIGRAEAQVLRLAMIYALLDGSSIVELKHLLAALALWRYFEDSARHIFGDPSGNQTADTILKALRMLPQGLTRSDISTLFSRHRSAGEIERALISLQQSNQLYCEFSATGGRAAQRWFAVDAKKANKLN
jgi:hypothetical protein